MEKIDYSQPQLNVPEHKKDDDWYKQCVRYFMTFYNRSSPKVNTGNPNDNLGIVDRGLAYASYYLGRQNNVNYNHLTTDLMGNTLQSVWIPGKSVQSLVNHRLGYLSRQFEEKDISATSLSPEVISQKQKLLEDALLKFDEDFKNVERDMAGYGVTYEPISGANFDSPEDLEKYVNQNIKNYGETIATNIAIDIEKVNDSDTEYKKIFLDYHCAGFGGMLNYVENGNVKERAIRFWDLIFDNLNDSPTKKNMQFAGHIERMTPTELFQKYDLNETQKSEIMEMAKQAGNPRGNSLVENWSNTYNTPSLTNWDYTQGQLLIAAVTMYFIAERDLRYKKNEDKFGGEHIERVTRKNKKGEYITYDLYCATLVGNKYLVKKGLANNVVRKIDNKSTPELPIKVFTHNTILGELMPPIGMISQHQDNMDFYRFKIMEVVSRDSGKNYLINGSKIEGTTSKSLITDFKSLGIHVTAGSTGESDDPTDAKRLVEFVDLTLDPNVMRYVELYREEESVMERIMSTNQTDLGQQVSYMSKGTQAATVQQSIQGTVDLYQNFVKFNNITLQHATELGKMVYTADGDTNKLFLTGDRGAAFLKITKELRFEDLLIWVSVNDTVDEQAKERLKAYVQAWSQNPNYGLAPQDIIKLEQSTTYSEMVAITEAAFRRTEKAKMEQQMQQQQMQMAMQQQQMASQEGQEQMRQQGANDRAAVNASVKVAGDQMAHDTTMSKAEMERPTAQA